MAQKAKQIPVYIVGSGLGDNVDRATQSVAQTSPGGADPSSSPPAPTSFLAPVKATWEGTRSLGVGLVEAMPEDKFDFKPTPAVRSFRDVVIHLVGENYLFFGRVAGEDGRNPAHNLNGRDELL